ncbi:MAG: hypothetical protein FRX49_06154 [Trebouxia sp. A1-2]|nr:MAG: hypothetical protein FRX49_06154 [Trebouxia sp. A1-2]
MLASKQLSARVLPVTSNLRSPVVPHLFACVAPRISEPFLVSAGRQCNVHWSVVRSLAAKVHRLPDLFSYVTLCSLLDYGKAS